MKPDLFAGGRRLQMTESIDLTVQSLQAYGPDHPVWAMTWSGGKDSTATLTLIVYLIASGRIPAPRRLMVFYADTRLELPPLAHAAQLIMDELRERGIDVHVVTAPLDKRFMVYILGRGVPPPNNNTLRWCTRQIKLDPMRAELVNRLSTIGDKVLAITGVRQGESAIRDARIEMSCGRDGAECGQGWFQQDLHGGNVDTLAPLLHWRVCHVWEWLKHWAPQAEFGDWDTSALADAYGGDEAEEINARTGCVGCPLAQQDTALDAVLRNERWAYLARLKDLRRLWRDLRRPENRLRKPGGETRQDGTLCANQNRLGPLTLEARKAALDRVLFIQDAVNGLARDHRRPAIDILNAEEEARIRELIAARTWPDGWDGDEPTGDVPLPSYFQDGSVQWLLGL